MSKKRCSYCGKLITEDKIYCSGECKSKYDEFEKYASKNLNGFIRIFVAGLITIFAGMSIVVMNSQIGFIVMMTGVVAVIGNLIIFPFATPETVKLLGIKKSILIVRSIGIAFLVGILFLIIGNWIS